MSGSDAIKELLNLHYPQGIMSGTWKRTSKKKVGDDQVRTFHHTSLNIDVTVLEKPSGAFEIHATGAVLQAALASVPAAPKPKAKKVEDIAVKDIDTSDIPEPTNKAPNKKALMKKGTKWRVTQDCTIYAWVDNPARDVKIAELRRKQPNIAWGGPAWEVQLAPIPEKISVPICELVKDTILSVTGKQLNDGYQFFLPADNKKPISNGTGIPFSFKLGSNNIIEQRIARRLSFKLPLTTGEIEVSGDDVEAVLPYKQIEKFVELEGEAKEQFIYLLRNKETGLFYRMTNRDKKYYQSHTLWDAWFAKRDVDMHGRHHSEAAWKKWREENPNPEVPHGRYVLAEVSNLAEYFEWEEKITKAKQYADMGKMKSSILTFVGYSAGLEEDTTSEGDQYLYMMQDQEGDEGYPFPPFFEAVKIEKFSKKEVEIIDVHSWYERTMSLRRLTATYGSAVRNLYNKLDKAGELSSFNYAVFFKTGKKDGWDDRVLPVSDDQITTIDDTIKQFGLNPKTVKRVKAQGSLAVAVDSLSNAIALKMGADSDLKVVMIDFGTMKELVES